MNQYNPATVYLWLRGVSAFAFSLIITYELVYHTIIVGLNPLQLVIVGVVLESITLLCEIPTGVIADAYSRRLSVILGFGLTGLGFLVEAFVPTFAAVILAQIIWGLGFTFFSGAEAAWITDEIGEEKATPLFVRASQLGQVMGLVGVIISTILATIQLSLPLLFGAVLYLLLTIMLIVSMSENGFKPNQEIVNQSVLGQMKAPFQASTTAIRQRPMLMMILWVGIVIGLYVGGFDRLYATYIINSFTLPNLFSLEPTAWFGILSGIISLLSLISLEMVRRFLDITQQAVIIRLLMVLYSGMIISGFIFALTSWFTVAAVCFCVSQTLRNVGRPMLIVWINQNTQSAVRATVISMYWQANGLGQVIGSPIMGWIGTVVSLRAALVSGIVTYISILPLLKQATIYEEKD